jgi:hypothetical protein
MLLNLSQIGPIALDTRQPTELAAPQRERLLRAGALMVLAVLVLALMSGFAIEVGPRCTGAAPASANLSIGGAIKVAGC